ncbi:GDF9 factor, partial [Polyodon spathula]|nr:GDF9 factor [Polyodon spathula]
MCFCLCYSAWLVLPNVCDSLCRAKRNSAAGPDDGPPNFEDRHRGTILLSSLLKALSDKDGWEDPTPRFRPDSKYLRYMKRLYRMSATNEGVPKLNKSLLYNTVRLFTPQAECLHKIKEVFTQDLSYSLDRVTAQEHLLKSVLLYSFERAPMAPVASVCRVHLSEQVGPDEQVCSSTQDSFRFYVRMERRTRRKWVEVDVTSFLKPLLGSYRKNIHILVNFTCVEDRRQKSSAQEQDDQLNHTLKAPSLVLYLNDTSEQAYRRGAPRVRMLSLGNPRPASDPAHFQSPVMVEKTSLRNRRNAADKELDKQISTPETFSLDEHYKHFEFPTDECELHDFRLIPPQKMGRHFGDLARIRHIVTYSLSPFEQKAFANYFSKGIPNVWRRFSSQVFKVAPRKYLMLYKSIFHGVDTNN